MDTSTRFLASRCTSRLEARHIFVDNTENFLEDVREIDDSFPFVELFCDSAFYAMKLIKEKLGKQVYALEVGPFRKCLASRPSQPT
ncbi:MAG: hypothetical protein R6V73_03915 [Anaerolineales bacterium]|jgi:aminoglycoside phosphotransferase family enzyme